MPRQRKLSPGAERNFRQLYLRYKRDAARREIEFEITLDLFRDLTRSACFLCGANPKSRYRHSLNRLSYAKPYIYNGVDRVQNKKGYLDGNVITCCWKCNCAKASLPLADFLLHTLDIYNYRIKPALKGDDT